MHNNAPPLSDLRLRRIHRWILLWLRWLSAFITSAEEFAPFSKQAEAIAHGWLDQIERGVLSLVIVRAHQRLRLAQPPKHSSRRRKERQQWRALIGSKLRRTLRKRDLATRIAALSQNPDTLVAHLVKRLPRGLTRRRPFIARPEPRAHALTHSDSKPTACADTS